MDRYERLSKNMKKSRVNSALSSVSKTDDRYSRLNAQMDLGGFRDAYMSGYEALQGAYGGWNSEEAMNSYRNTLTKANKAMSDYINTYSPSKEITDAYDNFAKALGNFDNRANLYSNYINADAFNKAKRNAELTEKYKGASYDKIQRALATAKDEDEKAYLKAYTGYSSLEDFDKAMHNTRDMDFFESLEGKRSNFAMMNAFDEYKGLMKNADFKDNINKDAILGAEDEVFMQSLQGGKISPLAKSIADRGITSDIYGTVPFYLLSPEMQDVGAYIYNKQGEEAYKNFMRKIAIQASAELNKEQTEEYRDFSTKNPLTGTVATIANVISSPVSAFGAGVEQVASIAKGIDYNPFQGMSGAQRMFNESQSAISQEIEDWGGEIPKMAYDALSVGVVSRLGQRAFGPMYNVIMGTGSFAQTYGDSLNSGMSPQKSAEKAMVAGAVESVTEAVGMDWAFKGGKTAIRTVLNQFLAEGSEELVGSLANLIYDMNRNGSEAEFRQNVQKYVDAGYSQQEATRKAIIDFSKDVAEQFVTAGLSAGFEGGVHEAITAQAGKTIDATAFNEAMKGFEGGDVYADYLNMLDAEGNLTNWQRGSLYNRALNEASEEYKSARKDLKKEISSGNYKVEDIVNRGEKAIDNYNNIFATQKGKLAKDIKVGEKTADAEGNDVKINDVVSEDGKIKVVTDNGTIEASAMTADEDTAYVMNKALKIKDEAVRQAYIAGYQGGNSVQYDANVELIVDDATRKLGMDTMLKQIDTNVISQSKAIDLYKAVQKSNAEVVIARRAKNDALIAKWNKQYKAGNFDVSEVNTEKLDSTKKRLVQFLNIFSKMGMNIKVIDDASRLSENGSTQGKNLVINLSARYGLEESTAEGGKYVVPTFAHESTHWMENILGEEFDTFKNLVRDYMGESKWNNFIALEQKNTGNKLSDADAESEVIARFCEDMLNDTSVADRLFATANESTIKKLINAIKKWFAQIRADIKNLMEGYESQSPEAQFARAMGEELKKVQDAWVEMFERALAVNQVTEDRKEKSENTKESEVRYSDKVDSEGNKLSVAQAEFFKDSKAVDADGDLQKVYHGTVREFYTFDRQFANVEGDWGKGFYFTNDINDVEANYANTEGADLTQKIETEADRLEYTDGYEDKDHDEIVEELRQKYITTEEPITLECYLNIKNPCYMNTWLFDDVASEISEEDYEDEDEYYEAQSEATEELVEAVMDDLRSEFDDYDTIDAHGQEIAQVMYDAVYEGGIRASDLKDRLNELYLESEEGLAGNEIARLIIKSLGYDGIIDTTVSKKFKRMGLSEDSTHYIVFESNQAKLTTNLNPTENDDIRYSKKVDSDGNKLTEEQERFFADSKVRDEEGNLLVMYHGTDFYKDFTVFKAGQNGYLGKGMYFTEKDYIAKKYAEQNGYEGRIYKVYLNLTNPLIVTTDNPALEILGEKVAKRRAEKNSYSTRWLTSADIKKLQAKGYDGIIWKYGKSPIEASAWNANQIKLTSNTKPTLNEDIRYSKKVDSKGNKLTEAQAEFFEDSKIRDVNGNLKVMYHVSPNEFTVFDKKKAKGSGSYGSGFYFSDAEMKYYGGKTYAVYLNIKNPISSVHDVKTFTDEQIKKFVQAVADNEDYGLDNYGYDATVSKVVNQMKGRSDYAIMQDINGACIGNFVEAVKLFNEVNGTDFDGIEVPSEVVAFYPEQIKNVDNKKPTESPDIRYSSKVSDADYEKLAYSNPEEARKILEATAREHGYDSPILYHGSTDWGFTEFQPVMLDDGFSIFLTSDLDTAQTYAGSREIGTTKENRFNVYFNKDNEGKVKLTTVSDLVNFYNFSLEGNKRAQVVEKEQVSSAIKASQRALELRGKRVLSLTPEKIMEWYKDEDAEITKEQATALKTLADKVGKQFVEMANANTFEEFKDADLQLQHVFKETSDYCNKEFKQHIYFHLFTDMYPIDEYPEYKKELYNFFFAYSKADTEGIVKLAGEYDKRFLAENDFRDYVEKNRNGAIYPLYAKLGKTLVVEGRGYNWNEIPVYNELGDKVPVDELAFDNDYGLVGYAKTRNFAEYARNAGYDSVIIKNVVDHGGKSRITIQDSDIYIVFKPANLASADLLTYDDNGKVIPLSERFTDDTDIRYSQKIGYHAGDLGKSESLGNQTGGRDTGHFGTGTYFVGDKSELQYGSYKERPIYEVDFSKYNLWEPLYEEEGLDIHRFLKGVNRYVNAPADEILGERAWEKLYDEVDNALYEGEYDAKDIYNKIVRLFGVYTTARKMGAVLHYGYATDGTLYDENDKEVSLEDALSKIDLNDLFSSFDRYDVRRASDYAEDYADWWRSFFRAHLTFNKSEEELQKIFREVQKEIQEFKGDAYKADSASTRFMKKLGYEGVDVRRFKRLDNTMYGSVIYDLKDEDLQLKQDIGTARFSQKVDTNELELLKQNKMLEKRNEVLKADVKRLTDLLKLQSKITGGMVLDDKKLKTQAEVLLKDVRSNYSVEDTIKGLRDVYEYILSESNGGEINWDVVMGKAYDLASKMLDKQKPYKWVENSYKDIYDTMRKARIKLTEEQKQEAKNAYGKDWYKEYFGSVVIANDGRSLDSYWQEWASQYPWVFDANTNPNDMATELLNVYDEVKDSMNVIQYFNSHEDKTALAYEIYNKFWNVPTIATLADKYQAQAKKLKFEHRQAIEELRASKKEAIEQVRASKRDVVKAVREDRDRKIADLKERIKEKESKRKDEAVRRATLNKIYDVSSTLMDWMQKNTAKEHVPDVLKPVVSQLLNSIDYSSKQLLGLRGGENKGLPTKRDVSIRTAIEKIRNIVNKSTTEEGMEELGRYVDFPPSYAEDLDTLYATVNAIALRTGEDNAYILNEMSTEQLAELYHMVKVMKHVVQNLNAKIAGAYGYTIAYEAQRDIQANKEIGAKENNNFVKKFFEWKNTLPVYAFEHLGQGASSMFAEIQDGWDKFAFNIKQVIDFSKETFTGAQVKEWGEHVNTFKVLVEPTMEELKNGGKPHEVDVQMTDTQIMSLYCLSKREHAKTHFAGGGIRVSDIKDGKKELVQVQNVRLSEKELQRIISTLSPGQIAVADKIQDFMNTVCSDWGNEVSMKRYGIKGFTEKNYFPIKVDANVISKETRDNEKSVYGLLNMSFTKPITPKASAQMEIKDIFDVFTIHASEMAKYNSIALPVLDMVKYYNYKEIDKDQVTTMKGSIEETFGKEAMAYINHFLVDLNGNQESGRNETVLKKLTRGYKTSAVAGNLQVMLLQPIAITRASLKIDEKYIVKGMVSFGKIKHGIEMMQKYSGIAVWKDLSLFDTNVSRGLDSHIKQDATTYDKVIEKSMKGAEWADKITWGAIWNACEAEARDRGFTGEELYTESAKKFRDIIYHTQVVDSTMTRTDMMRSPSLAVQWATSFMSEPSISMNILQDATIKYSQDARRYGKGEAFRRNGKTIAKAVEIYTINVMAESILRGLVGKWRDLDSEEDILEGMWKEFLENINPLANIPLGRDIVSIFSGYSVDRMDMATVQSMYYAYKGWEKVLGGDDVSYKTIYRTMQAMSQATGIPLSSLLREATTIWNNTIAEMYPYLKIE